MSNRDRRYYCSGCPDCREIAAKLAAKDAEKEANQ
jgi:ssDNA-binding Zn-finger/Zn-ribbon topoisomerase 1